MSHALRTAHRTESFTESVIREMTRKHFEVARHFLRARDWDYFQLVEIGLDRIHHGFWKHHDPSHVLHDPESPYRTVIRDYYRTLDHEIGTLLDRIRAAENPATGTHPRKQEDAAGT